MSLKITRSKSVEILLIELLLRDRETKHIETLNSTPQQRKNMLELLDQLATLGNGWLDQTEKDFSVLNLTEVESECPSPM